jgi:hypothetical protein
MVSKLPSSVILICKTEIAYVAVSEPVLARFISIVRTEPSNTARRGVISRLPCACTSVPKNAENPDIAIRSTINATGPGQAGNLNLRSDMVMGCDIGL